MAFDINDWIDEHLDGARPSKGGAEFTAPCPWCGKYGGFYVNSESGAFVCFKCRDVNQSSGKAIYPLIAQVEGITYAQARARVLRGTVAFARRKVDRDTLMDSVRALRGKEAALLATEVEAPLPRKFIPVFDKARPKQWKFPTYLKQRGFTREIAAKFGLGFVSGSCWYPEGRDEGQIQIGDRLIIPINCPSGESFTARDVTDRQFPKYINPPGIDNRKMIIGWEHVKKGGDIVLVEGPLDALKLHQHGLPALGLLGKNLSREQAALLFRWWPEDAAVTIMLDPEERVAPIQLALQLRAKFKNVYIARLPDEVDPGASTAEQARTAYDSAKRFKGSRVAKLAAKLGMDVD